MKKSRLPKIGMAVCLILGMLLMPFSQLKVQAAEVIATVQGTVLAGTTAEILQLSTPQGKMEIKLDNSTDYSDCKVLLPNKAISVSVSHGSDAYLHAVKISNGSAVNSTTLDTSNASTVVGTISKNTTNEILQFSTAQGEMEIKLDPTTDMSSCSVLIMGKTYSISCARGSDAYMHAIKITDSFSTAAVTPTYSVPSGASTTTVSGKVTKNTKENLLCLDTAYGEMELKIDSSADTGRGFVLTPGRKLSVTCYHGSDAYMHAVCIVGEKDSSSATVDTSSTTTVSGTVDSKSNENILYLDTAQGEMELKLDAVKSLNNCKVIVVDKKLTVTCAYGSDAYMHAIDITGA